MAGIEEKQAAKNDTREKEAVGKKPEPVVLVECAYEVDYVLREDVFNAWPYFREYLQNNRRPGPASMRRDLKPPVPFAVESWPTQTSNFSASITHFLSSQFQ